VTLAVLHDEAPDARRPDERDSLEQARFVARQLEAAGREATPLPLGLDLAAAARALVSLAPDLVVNLVESVGGKGSLIHLAPALIEALGLRFTGASSAAMFATTRKVLAKRMMIGVGLPTPPWVEAGTPVRSDARPGRWVLKPVCEDASVGLDDAAVVSPEDPARLPALIAGRADRLGCEVFAERYVEGREFNLSLLAKGGDLEVLPPAEIVFSEFPDGKPRIVGYAAKWDPDSFEYRHTPRRFDLPREDGRLLSGLERLARRSWGLFGLSGYARVDFRVDPAGRPWILEVNANPCLSEDAGFAAAAEHANLSPRDVIERIIDAAR
jgi:D-alanine-D-alanine ligase